MDNNFKSQFYLFDHAETLLKKRETICEKILAIKEKKALNKILLLEENASLLDLTKELKNIDALLDQTAENFDQKTILFSLLQITQLSDRDSIRNKIEEIEQYIFKIKEFLQFLTPILRKLEIIQSLITHKRRNVLTLFFCRHPKILLAYEWQSLLELLQEKAPKMFEILLPSELQNIQIEIKITLENLKSEIEKKWNSQLYQDTCLPKVATIQDHYRKIETALSNFEKKKREQMADARKWIEVNQTLV